MDDRYRNNANLYQGAKDIAREMNQVSDDYRYQDSSYEGYAPSDGYYHGGNEPAQEEDAQSDATEGHDEDDEVYEGEYQGIPHPDDVKGKHKKKAPGVADDYRDHADLMTQRMEDEEQLAHQYENIIEECGHGRFQWTLFFVLGLALMADGIEVFVVGFVLPSAEKDMCLSRSNKGMLGWGFGMGTKYQFHSWRVFVLVCVLPCISSLIALKFMPESPRFLLETGKHDEAWMILKQVHDTNMRAKGEPERVFTVAHIKTPKQIDEFIEIQSSTGTWYQRWLVRFTTTFKQVWDNVLCCLTAKYKMNTLILGVVWFTMALSYYGLIVWFPDMIRYFQDEAYKSRRQNFTNDKISNATFNFTLENQIHTNVEYINDTFMKIKLKHVTFEDTLFKNCYFIDVTSSETYFNTCTFEYTIFNNTDLYKHKFIDCKFLNSSEPEEKEGCHLDFEEDNDFLIYLVSFLGSLSVLPGNIVSALLMDKIGRIRMIGGSMLISAVCCFFLFFGNSDSAMIGWQCLFCGASIAAWNALDVITVELYPTDKRATAFGILNGLCKFGAILGNSIFASFVGITEVVPILLASSALVGGGLLALRLPETREQVLM
ncbi:synaptic vesicle glycoprotein 2B isoform X2 [Alligator sinensis]|uniref:Synaptic vesicle glycoprotein 2B isoform X2 n=1 Tax=Alligator sinensis TaxID=38654 RepID=A0A3Q0HBC3_ALLSI|nr:synaptic vesicle glycoprotein 2B isoform X2 [Alligator sinensis]